MMTLSESLTCAFAEAYNRQGPSNTVALPRGLKFQVRHADDGLRRIKAWRDSRRPSSTEIKVLARDAGFMVWHAEYPAFGFAVIILEDPDTVQDDEIKRAAKTRAERQKTERVKLEEKLMNMWAELCQVHEHNLDGYRELWRMRFEQESLEWVREQIAEARAKLEAKKHGVSSLEKAVPDGVLKFEEVSHGGNDNSRIKGQSSQTA